MSNPKKVTASSGNVFADLGFSNPEEELFGRSLFAKSVRSSNAGSLLKPRLRPCSVSSSRTFLL